MTTCIVCDSLLIGSRYDEDILCSCGAKYINLNGFTTLKLSKEQLQLVKNHKILDDYKALEEKYKTLEEKYKLLEEKYKTLEEKIREFKCSVCGRLVRKVFDRDITCECGASYRLSSMSLTLSNAQLDILKKHKESI